MTLDTLRGLAPTIDPFRVTPRAPGHDFSLDLSPERGEAVVRPLPRPPAAPPAPDFEGAERQPLVHMLVGDATLSVENRPGLQNVRVSQPLVGGGGGGVNALAGFRREGDSAYLDAGLRASGRVGAGAVTATGAVELVGAVPLGGATPYGAGKAEARLNLGDAFVGAAAETTTLAGAPLKLEANAGVATPVGTLSVHRNWNAGDPRADTSLRLTNGDLRVEAGRDDRVGDAYLRVNLRARF